MCVFLFSTLNGHFGSRLTKRPVAYVFHKTLSILLQEKLLDFHRSSTVRASAFSRKTTYCCTPDNIDPGNGLRVKGDYTSYSLKKISLNSLLLKSAVRSRPQKSH
jgi:hypothetical protein